MLLNNTLIEIERKIVITVYSAWLILGVPGGILNLLIFSRRHMRKTSCCVYFFATSLNNLVSLGIGVIPVLYSLHHPDPLITSVVFCKVRGYFLQISLMVSRWFISFASIDRYATSSSNPRLRAFAQVKVAYRSIIGIIIFWCTIAIHRLVFYEVKGRLCAIISHPEAAVVHTVYVLLGGGVLPASIMITFTILIRRNLFIKSQKLNRNVTIKFLADQQKRKESLDIQVITILYIQIVCYIILMTPQMGNVTYNAIVANIPNRGTDVLAIDRMIAFLAELMMYVFPVASFYLYTLSSATFRSELIDTLGNIYMTVSKRFQKRTYPLETTDRLKNTSTNNPPRAETNQLEAKPLYTIPINPQP